MKVLLKEKLQYSETTLTLIKVQIYLNNRMKKSSLARNCSFALLACAHLSFSAFVPALLSCALKSRRPNDQDFATTPRCRQELPPLEIKSVDDPELSLLLEVYLVPTSKSILIRP